MLAGSMNTNVCCQKTHNPRDEDRGEDTSHDVPHCCHDTQAHDRTP